MLDLLAEQQQGSGAPFDAPSQPALMNLIYNQAPTPLSTLRAGVHPAVDQVILRALAKSPQERYANWDEFAQADAPVMDFVLTVCDNAAGEVCPLWPGQPISAHWGVADPSAVLGSESEVHQAFLNAFITLRTRIGLLLELPIKKLNHLALHQELHRIAREGR